MSAPGPAPGKVWGFRIKTMKNHDKFTKNENGGIHHYTLAKSQQNWEKAKEHFLSKIKINEKILEEGPGIYTWILKADNFYATKVTTPQEIGTLHFIIDELTSPTFNPPKSKRDVKEPVILAGELQINDDGSIVFNLLSGSYSGPLKNGLNDFHLGRLSQAARPRLRHMITQLFDIEYTDLRNGINDRTYAKIPLSIEQMMRSKFRTKVTYTDQPLIDGASIITSRNDIKRFSSFLIENEQEGGKSNALRRTHRRCKTHRKRKTRKTSRN